MPDETALRDMHRKLMAASLELVAITECDAPYDGALMALGLVPGRKEDIRRHLSCLPLLR